jgi:hypothetical protein
MPISVDDVEVLRSILSALPRHQPQQVSQQEAIASLASELRVAQRRGYTTDDLARLMSEKGVEINGPTLRNCLRRLRKKRRARDKSKAGTASGGSSTKAADLASDDQKVAVAVPGASTKPPEARSPRELSAPKSEA